jgi:hypothetical protein
MTALQRTLSINTGPAAVPVPIDINLPFQDGGSWRCTYSIGWPGGIRNGHAMGFDAVTRPAPSSGTSRAPVTAFRCRTAAAISPLAPTRRSRRKAVPGQQCPTPPPLPFRPAIR